MFSPRSQLLEYIAQGLIEDEKIEQALIVSKLTPSASAWGVFVSQLLLWVGSLALASSVLFFIAYNWAELGHFAKFGMLELLLFLAVVVYWRKGPDTALGKASLSVATVFLGVLLALFGQTYQTGVDTWQLFFYWALLMLPWAMVGRFSVIWMLWIVLLNLSSMLYVNTFGVFFWFSMSLPLFWFIFIINTVALIVWELLKKKRPWLQQNWAIGLLGVGSGIPITWLACEGLLGGYGVVGSMMTSSIIAWVVWGLWMLALYVVYRHMRPNLFMLSGMCASGITVLVVFFVREIVSFNSASVFLLIALLIVSLAASAAIWLRRVHREMQI